MFSPEKSYFSITPCFSFRCFSFRRSRLKYFALFTAFLLAAPCAVAVASKEQPSSTPPAPQSADQERTDLETTDAEKTASPDPQVTGSESTERDTKEPETTEAPPPESQQGVETAPVVENLSLLNASIPPGQFQTLYWSPGQSFASIDTPVPVLVAHGKNPGPRVCLTAAIHGDELNGIEMVRRLMYQLEPVKMNGTVIGVPIVNLDGFRRASRYLSDRRDLNRYFPGSENGSAASRIAYSFFNKIIRGNCDFLVDLHTGSLKRTNLPQIRADLSNETVFEFSRHLGGITVLHGRGSEGTLRRAATDLGIPAITLESGGPNSLDESSVDGGVKALETLLQNLDIQPTVRFWGTPQPVFYHSEWVRSDQGGILMSDVELGDTVREGDVLGRVVDPVSNTGSDIVSPLSGKIIGMAFNQVVQTGFAAYHIGEAKTPEEAKEEAQEELKEESQESGSVQSYPDDPETAPAPEDTEASMKKVSDSEGASENAE